MDRPRRSTWAHFAALLEPLHARARLSARRLSRSPADGDDLFHEALLRAFEKLHTLNETDRFEAWFHAILLSVHRNRSRRAFWRRFVRLDGLLEVGYDPAGADGRRQEREIDQAARLSRALSRLSAVQREAVVLHDVDGYSMEEVAVLQRASLTAVKSRVARGRERLRRHYERIFRLELREDVTDEADEQAG